VKPANINDPGSSSAASMIARCALPIPLKVVVVGINMGSFST